MGTRKGKIWKHEQEEGIGKGGRWKERKERTGGHGHGEGIGKGGRWRERKERKRQMDLNRRKD